MNYKRKYNTCKTLDVDTSKRQVKVAIAQLESIDRDEEAFDVAAFNKTIKENGPKGSNEIWHLLDHNSKSFSALSKFKEVGIDGSHVYGVSEFRDTFAWREVAWPLYEAGDFTQHSVGFVPLKSQKSKDGSHTIITDVILMEGSAVLWGANPNTPTMEVSKSIKSLFDDADLTSDEIFEQRYELLLKRIRDERFSDMNKGLLMIELMQLKNYLKIPTKPEEKTTLPERLKLSLNLLTN